MDLVEAGTITGPVTTSLAMGSRRLYDLVDDDPRFAFHPIDHVCDPAVIAARERMVSVTQAFTIDLTGQVSHRGSRRRALRRGVDRAGLPSRRARVARRHRGRLPRFTNPAGRSAITVDLEPGEAVTIPRADVHWVITEYGTAYLFGRSLAERAVALIEIAHPDDREQLLDARQRSGLVGRRQQLRSRIAYPVARSATCACATAASSRCAPRERGQRARCRTCSTG